MARGHLSDEYAQHLDGQVEWDAVRLAHQVIVRLAEYLWLHYPGARRVLIATDDITGRAEPVQIIGEDERPLWSVDGPGWEPGGDNGPLQSLAPGDAADRHGALIQNDIALLGTLLPEGTQCASAQPGRGIRSTVPGADWEVTLPTRTDRLQFLAEEKLGE